MAKSITMEDLIFRFKKLREKSENQSSVMKKIARSMKTTVNSNFRNETDFKGKRWTKSKRAKLVNGQTLSNTGRLRRSFTSKYRIDYAVCGTNVKYAKRLNFGAKKGEDGKKTFRVGDTHVKGCKVKESKTKKGTIRRAHKRRPYIRRAHNRTAIVPFGNISAYNFIGINEKQKKMYLKWIKEFYGEII